MGFSKLHNLPVLQPTIPCGHSVPFRKCQEQEPLWETKVKTPDWNPQPRASQQRVRDKEDLSASPSGALTGMHSINIMLKKH